MKLLPACLTTLAMFAGMLAPVAAFQEAANRIIVNVRDDGTFANEALEVLAGEKAIAGYVESKKAAIEKKGVEPQLHLRGDKEAVFKHGRIAVRAAKSAGVDQVVFAVFVRDNDDEKPPTFHEPGLIPEPQPIQVHIPDSPRLGYWWISSLLKPRDSDLNLELPGAEEDQKDGAILKPLLIVIEGNGTVLLDGKIMDMDPKVRELPLLGAALQFAIGAHEAAGLEGKPLVQIYASDEVQHQRVIDVLNALAHANINSVTFTDLTEEK